MLPLQVPEGGRGAAPGTACGADNVHLQDRGSARHELLRSEQLIAKKRRNKLAAADKTICYLTRGTFKEDQHDTGFTDTRWVELEELYEKCGGKAPLNRALKKYRDMEQGALRQLPSVRRALTNEHVQSIRDYIVCRRVDRTAFLRNVQRIAECIVHFFLIEELVAEDDQLVIVD